MARYIESRKQDGCWQKFTFQNKEKLSNKEKESHGKNIKVFRKKISLTLTAGK